MGYEVESMVDIEQVQELSPVNGDLGRLGDCLSCGFPMTREPVIFPHR